MGKTGKFKSYKVLLGCEVCGKLFKGRVYDYGYTDKICSKACKAARRAEKIEDITCICGKVFTAYKSEHRKTCCLKCKLDRQHDKKLTKKH